MIYDTVDSRLCTFRSTAETPLDEREIQARARRPRQTTTNGERENVSSRVSASRRWRDTDRTSDLNSPARRYETQHLQGRRRTQCDAGRRAHTSGIAPHMTNAHVSRVISHHEHSTSYDRELHWLHAPTCSSQGSAASRLATSIVAAPETRSHHS